MTWGFYGPQAELRLLGDILSRGRWFFAMVTGRRRIGKTTLIQQALPATGRAYARPVTSRRTSTI